MATVAPPRAAAEAPASIPIAILAFLGLGGVLYRVARS